MTAIPSKTAIFSSARAATDAITQEGTGLEWVLIVTPSRLEIRAQNAVGPDPLVKEPASWGIVFATVPPGVDSVRPGRGDVVSLAQLGGETVVGVDLDGRLIAELHPETLARAGGETVTGGVPEAAKNTGGIGRGDYIPVVRLGAEIVLGVDANGQTRLMLDAQSIAHVSDNIVLPDGQPEGPDSVPDFDAWNVRRKGDILYFNAHIWGEASRDYLRRGPGDPWINGRSEALIRLLYGDEMTDVSVDGGIAHFTHVMTFDDGYGQAGLNGAPGGSAPRDIQRPDRGFASSAADSWLRHARKTRPWIGVRSEGVMGADLRELIDGTGYANLIRARESFEAVLKPYGRHPAIDTVSILMAAITDNAVYADELLELIENIVRDTGTRQVNIFQPVGDAFSGRYPAVLGTMNAFLERGALPVVPVSALYCFDRRPGSLVSLAPRSAVMLAELDGLAGRDWLPPLAFGHGLDGRDLHIDFEVMAGCSLVAPSTGLVIDSDNDVTITDVTVVPDPITKELTRLSIALSDAPQNGVIRYAYDNLTPSVDLSGTAFCSGGDLRDDWECPSVTGGTLHRYAFSFERKI